MRLSRAVKKKEKEAHLPSLLNYMLFLPQKKKKKELHALLT